jgi:hypothetical protein
MEAGGYYPTRPLAGSGPAVQVPTAVVFDADVPVPAKVLLMILAVDSYADEAALAAYRGWSAQEVQHGIEAIQLAGYARQVREQ